MCETWWQKRANEPAAYLTEAIKVWNKEYYQRNKIKITTRIRERRKTQPQVAIACRLRNRILKSLHRKSLATKELIGCSWPILVQYLEANFKPGMTWKNRNQWHIDHIRPLASFDLTDPEQQRQACHYTNLQPLWAKENRQKGAKLIDF